MAPARTQIISRRGNPHGPRNVCLIAAMISRGNGARSGQLLKPGIVGYRDRSIDPAADSPRVTVDRLSVPTRVEEYGRCSYQGIRPGNTAREYGQGIRPGNTAKD
ncbi:unnamed protein product [Bursaphelenchus okinawaensis]|uniref:Uncharacterized protein n=1 Tax=Bursaphelenchus okinawaensis TaxID=465554 RepID=A0A811LKL7_9BILA|nr:unnamed protein product [Bursaphelenchus okinawaensis]CAG9123994.1 unnamed protein product [Bursaphelenchus okinawaensis]